MSLTPLPEGHVGAVVTYLEMTERPHSSPSLPPRARSARGTMRSMVEGPREGDHAQPGGGAGLRLERWPAPDPDRYRALFRKVGARWLWYSRLVMDDERLRREMAEVHAVVDSANAEVGLLELDFRAAGECLIRFLGLVPELTGKGHGGWLFDRTLDLAWRPGVGRVHVNTCTLDHPAALPAYLRAGFTAYRRAFESFPDPRLSGLLPADSAPHLPLVGGGGGG